MGEKVKTTENCLRTARRAAGVLAMLVPLGLLAPAVQAAPVLPAGHANALVATLPGPAYQAYGSIAIDTAGNRYVTGGLSDAVYKVDATGHVSAFADPTPGSDVMGLAVAKNHLYLGAAAGWLSQVDLSTGKMTNLATPDGTPLALAYGAGKLYVGTEKGLFAYDTETNSFAATSLGAGVYNGLAFTNDGHLLVADYWNNRILSYDTESKTSSVFRAGVNGIGGIAVHATGRVYAAAEGSGQLLEISADGSTASVFGSNFDFNIGYYPTALAFSADGSTLYHLQSGPGRYAFQMYAIDGFQAAAPVPEPSALAMSLLGLGAVFVSKRRSRERA